MLLNFFGPFRFASSLMTGSGSDRSEHPSLPNLKGVQIQNTFSRMCVREKKGFTTHRPRKAPRRSAVRIVRTWRPQLVARNSVPVLGSQMMSTRRPPSLHTGSCRRSQNGFGRTGTGCTSSRARTRWACPSYRVWELLR